MAPAGHCFDIVPSDGVELSEVTKAIYIGSGGDVVLKSLGSTEFVTFRNVPAGFILDVRVRQVKATGTTAADLVGLA